MAPELFGGAKHADARADIYAVAVTLYEMLSGRLPFTAETYEELVVQVATQRPAPISIAAPHVSPPIASCVDRGLARDREARWQTADQFSSALRGALLGIAPPSSHQFEPTLDVHSFSPPPYIPTVPSLGAAPEPSTLRTAPPPVVNTASRRETKSRGALSWVVGIVGIALLAGAGGAFGVWRVMNVQNAKNASASLAVADSTSVPVAGAVSVSAPVSVPGAVSTPDSDSVPVAVSVTAVPAPLATHASHPASPGGVHFTSPPKIVGSAHLASILSLETLVTTRAQRCRPDGTTPSTARVDLFVQDDGTISLAHPKPNDPGDAVTAACLAAIFKQAATPTTFAPGGSGIVTVEATLDPR